MFDFFVEQILGMQWLNDLVWYVLINYFHADQNSNWWSSAHFFFYDTIKITILLVTLIYLISYIQSYFPPEKTKRILTHFDGFTGNIIAALLGTVTPFCSCSSVPIFIGFTCRHDFFFFDIFSYGRCGIYAYVDVVFWT